MQGRAATLSPSQECLVEDFGMGHPGRDFGAFQVGFWGTQAGFWDGGPEVGFRGTQVGFWGTQAGF